MQAAGGVYDLYLSRPDTLEEALAIIYDAADAFSTIVIDSLPALPVKVEREGGEPAPSRNAASVLSRGLPLIAGKIRRTGATLIVINQLRDIPGAFFKKPERPTGGHAIRHYSSLTLEITRTGIEKEPGPSDPYAQTCRVDCLKCKYSAPGRTAHLKLYYGLGFNHHVSIHHYIDE